MIPKETENDNPKNFFKAASSSYIPASSSWTRLKDPRIVRVSRAFGGKDRHSKVCTVRGLRDRRVRLSVPTAIQLYDLQDRLGLNQPSKVVDWLLNIAKNEIDELPPLQIPQGSFSSMISTFQAIGTTSSSPKIGGSIVNWNDPPEHSRSVDNLFGGKPNKDNRDETWRSEDQERRQFDNSLENQGALLYASASNNNTHPSLQIPYSNSFVRWDASNVLTLSHHHHDQPPKSNGLITAQNEDWHNFSLQLPNVVYQTGIMSAPVAQSYFPSQISARDHSAEFDPKEVNYRSSQLASSSQLSTANLLPSQNNDGN